MISLGGLFFPKEKWKGSRSGKVGQFTDDLNNSVKTQNQNVMS